MFKELLGSPSLHIVHHGTCRVLVSSPTVVSSSGVERCNGTPLLPVFEPLFHAALVFQCHLFQPPDGSWLQKGSFQMHGHPCGLGPHHSSVSNLRTVCRAPPHPRPLLSVRICTGNIDNRFIRLSIRERDLLRSSSPFFFFLLWFLSTSLLVASSFSRAPSILLGSLVLSSTTGVVHVLHLSMQQVGGEVPTIPPCWSAWIGFTLGLIGQSGLG